MEAVTKYAIEIIKIHVTLPPSAASRQGVPSSMPSDPVSITWIS
jgi:hypothetical protein